MAGIQIWLQSIKSQLELNYSLFNTVDLRCEGFSIFVIYRIYHLECHFNNIVGVCDGCHTCGRQRLISPEHLVLLSAGRICHGSLQW